MGSEYVSIGRLEKLTRENGLVGMILAVLKQLKSEDEEGFCRSSNLSSASCDAGPSIVSFKCILEDFTDTLYK